MNLNHEYHPLGSFFHRVSIPIRDLMNLNPVVIINPLSNIHVSIPIRDLMNLNLLTRQNHPVSNIKVSIPIRDLMNLNPKASAARAKSLGFQSLLGI